MDKNIEVPTNRMNATLKTAGLYILIGVLIGGLAGATTMLFVAPQSGKRTRLLIKNKTLLMRDRTSKNIKKAVGQIRSGTDQLTSEVTEKAGELKHISQEKLVEQLDRVSAAIDAAESKVVSG